MSNEMQKQLAILKEKYLVALPDKVDAIRSLWTDINNTQESDRLEELHRMAHSLAGSGATFDQIHVSKCSKDLENYIKEHVASNDIFEASQVEEVNIRLQKLEGSVHHIPDEDELSGVKVEEIVDVKAIEVNSSEGTEATLARMKINPMRILLADDDSDIRDQLKFFLKSRGHEVFEAKNGQEAINIFVDIMPDLVVMDVVMPGMAGYEATKILKEKSDSKFVPVIFLTSNSDDETLARCISAGGDDFLTKPVNPIILNAKLQAFQRIRIMYEKLGEYQQKTEEELETSKHVLNSLINNANDEIKGLSCWADSPGHFSGDTRLFKTLDNGHVYVLLCDFTGHGLPAAIGTVFAADLFRSMTHKSFDAEIILNEINSKMNQILPTGRYCAAIMLDYDPSVARLKIWNSGLPTAYLLNEDYNILQEIPSSGVPLGVMGGEAKCEVVEIDVNQGDSILIFSDGITEAENPVGEMYAEKRLLDCIAGTNKEQDIFNVLKDEVETFMQGMEPTDDISLVVLSFDSTK